ncbi:MAG TPA: carboxylesterase family protein [Spongiibacteraceae bacterium]
MKKYIAIAMLVVGIALIAIKPWTHHADNNSLRRLSDGDVVGFADKYDTYAWLGIPFAQAPLGELRWRAPRPLAPWNATRKALKFSARCAQLSPITWHDQPFTVGSEDCLYLNVWTPRLAQQQIALTKLPVMVWIHGGGNTLGYSSLTKGYHLAGTQHVIVVSLQYRLGVFGWLSHPALRNAAINSGFTPADTSSNFALLDMIAGLQWVKNNIAAFGGDPNNVTIFGESSGAQDVFALLAAPPAKGLFHRAIAQSGLLRTMPQAAAENYRDDAEPGIENSSREFINKLLIADGRARDRDDAKAQQQNLDDAQLLNYLRSKSAQELLAVVKRRTLGMYFTPVNIQDGYALPQKPLIQIFADPTQYNSVPIMLGSNRDEYKLFLWSKPEFTKMRFGFVPQIKDIDNYNRIAGYFSDQWQAIGVDQPAAILQRSQGDTVFAYRLDWADQPTLGDVDLHELFGAGHSVDLPFVFGSDATTGFPFLAKTKNSAAQAKLSAAIMNYWAAFAKNGAPGNGGDATLPLWQPWQPEGAKKLIFNTTEHGGIRISEENIRIADLKRRVHNDTKIQSARERCQLYVQLFLLALSDDYWSDDEYATEGCAQYPTTSFQRVL